MSADIRTLLVGFAGDMQTLLEPLTEVIEDPPRLYALLAEAGWNLEGLLGVDPAPLLATVGEMKDAISAAVAATNDTATAAALSDAAQAGIDGLNAAKALATELPPKLIEDTVPTISAPVAEALVDDLLALLIVRYLRQQWPVIFKLGVLLGVIRRETATILYAGDDTAGSPLRVAVRRNAIPFARLGKLRDNPFSMLFDEGDVPPFETLLPKLQSRLSSIIAGSDLVNFTDATVTLDPAGIEVSGAAFLEPDAPTVSLDLVLTDELTLMLTFELDAIRLAWANDSGTNTEYPLFEMEGFALTAGGGSSSGCSDTALTIGRDGSGLEVNIRGALGLQLPLELLSGATGDVMTARGCGHASLNTNGTVIFALQAASLTVDELTVGNLVVRDAGVSVSGVAFPPPDTNVLPFDELTIGGKLALAAGDTDIQIEVLARYESGAFLFISSGEVNLANGVRLRPIDTEPVLSLQLAADDTTTNLQMSVAGAVDVPTDDGTLTSVQVQGHFQLQRTAGGLEIVDALVSGSISTDLVLPGGIRIRSARVALSYTGLAVPDSDMPAGLSLSLGGELDVNGSLVTLMPPARISYDDTAALNIRIEGGVLLTSNLELFESAHLISGQLLLAVQTQPAFMGTLTVFNGSGGLFPRSAVPTDAADFELALDDLSAEFSFSTTGFSLVCSNGQLLLPGIFSAESGSAIIDLSVSDDLLELRYDASASIPFSFSGTLSFQDFGVTFPGSTGANTTKVQLTRADLVFDSSTLPRMENVSGYVQMQLPLPPPSASAGQESQIVQIGIDGVNWDLNGLPQGDIVLQTTVAMAFGGGFALELQGSSDPAFATRLSLVEGTNGYAVFTFAGALRLTCPVEMLAEQTSTGSRVLSIGLATELTYSSAPDGGFNIAALDVLVSGSFRIGNPETGLFIQNATLAASGLHNLLMLSDDQPFLITISGTVAFSEPGPSLTLKDALFSFSGPPQWLDFQLGGFDLSAGDESLIEGLPLTITSAGIEFDEETLPLPELLAPENIVIKVSAALQLPLGGDSAALGSVTDLSVQLDDGIPQVDLGGLTLGVEDLTVYPGIEVSGALGLGGLSMPIDPSAVIIAGKVGGKFNDAGVVVTLATRLHQPLGIGLDVSGGPAGIPLWTTGILLTGAAGGVSFANNNGDPTRFTTYLTLPDDGPPYYEDPPESNAPGMPGPIAGEGRIASERPTRSERPGCPGDCPPESMNLLCQPHPDQEAYPGRTILKFSALDENFLAGVILPDNQSLLEYLQQLDGVAPTDGITQVIDALQGAMIRLLPAVPAGTALQPLPPAAFPAPPELEAIIRDPLGYFLAKLREQLELAVAVAGADRSFYEIVRAELHKGLTCPDVTLQLSGTFSYTGVSNFASITGGINISTTGAAGIIGTINVLGIPIGQLRAFIVLTDENGVPDPSICGDIQFSVGPLDLGQLGFEYVYGINAETLTEAISGSVIQAIADGAEPFLQPVIATLDEALPDHTSLADAISDLKHSQALVLMAELLNRPPPPGFDVHLRNILARIIKSIWGVYQPSMVMCGQVAPKLFGLPLTGSSQGELVSVSAFADKERMGASFGFSPSYLLGLITGMPNLLPPVDYAVFGYALELPDPVELVLDGLTGVYQTPEELKDYLEQGIQHLFANAAFTIEYNISPFGLKIASAAARVLIPRFIDHPARRGSMWKVPDERDLNLPDDQRLPSRAQVLAASVAGDNLLADTLWDGRLKDLDIADRAPLTGLYLDKDYFPHGGIIGAGRLELPRALTDSPPLELFEVILDARANPIDRLGAAGSFIGDYVLTTRRVGEITFYAPAPNPPAFATQGLSLSSGDLMEAIVGLGNNPAGFADSFPQDLVFMRGFLHGQLLGVPIGDAEIEVIPPDAEAGIGGLLEIRTNVLQSSWLSALVGNLSLTFTVHQPPPLPVEHYFWVVAALLKKRPTSLSQTVKVLSDLKQALATNAETMVGKLDYLDAATRRTLIDDANEQRAEAFSDLLEDLQDLGRALGRLRSLQSRATVLLDYALRTLVDGLPKVVLEVEVDNLQLPQVLASFVSVSVSTDIMLYAFSPYFEPEYGLDAGGRVVDGSEYARVRREGGVVLRASELVFQLGPIELTGSMVDLAIAGTGNGTPKISANVDIDSFTPFPGITFEASSLNFGTHPSPYLSVNAKMQSINLGGLRIEPLDGGDILSVSLDQTGRFTISPARIVSTLPWLILEARIHGQSADQPFSLSVDGVWSAYISVDELGLGNPFDASQLLVNVAASGELSGDGLTFEMLSLTVAAEARQDIALFPALPVLSAVGTASDTLSVYGDGRFVYTSHRQLTLANVSFTGNLSIGIAEPSGTRRSVANRKKLTLSQRANPAMVRLTRGRRVPVLPEFEKPGKSTARPFATLDANVEFGPLLSFGTVLKLTPQRLYASGISLAEAVIGREGLFDVQPRSLSLDIAIRANLNVELVSEDFGVWLFGAEIASFDSLRFSASVAGFSVTCQRSSNSWITVIPSLLQLKPSYVRLDVGGADFVFSTTTSVRIFPGSSRQATLDNLMLGNQSSDAGPFSITLLSGVQFGTALPSSGMIARNSQTRLRLQRSGAGVYTLGIDNVVVNAFGETSTLNASIASNGQLDLSWAPTNQTLVSSNLLSLETDGVFEASINFLGAGSSSLRVPDCLVYSTIHGWPSGGIEFPGFDTTSLTPSMNQVDNRATPGWQDILSVAEFRGASPRIRVALTNGNQLVTFFDPGALTVRLKADWSVSESLFPGEVSISSNGRLTGLALPALPKPQDIMLTLRGACLTTANSKVTRNAVTISCLMLFPRSLYGPDMNATKRSKCVSDTINAAKSACYTDFPLPGPLPDVTSRSLYLTDFVS